MEVFNTTKLLNAFYKADELKKVIKVKTAKESIRLGRKNERLSKVYRSK